MAQSVKSPTLDFHSAHYLMVRGIEPHIGPFPRGCGTSGSLAGNSCVSPSHAHSGGLIMSIKHAWYSESKAKTCPEAGHPNDG